MDIYNSFDIFEMQLERYTKFRIFTLININIKKNPKFDLTVNNDRIFRVN